MIMQKIFKRTMSVIMLAMIIMCSVFSLSAAYAEEYTVLNDFVGTDLNMSEFPEIPGDYSVKVVQLAETSDGMLIVYAYQPSLSSRLTAVNITLKPDFNNTTEYKTYDLKFIGNYETLYKYSVSGFKVSSATVRYYDISKISRRKKDAIDNTDSDTVSYDVGQRWTAKSVSNTVEYSCINASTVDITDGVWNVVRPDHGTSKDFRGTDRHYIAFVADMSQGILKDIRLEYTVQDITDNLPLTYPYSESLLLSELEPGNAPTSKWQSVIAVEDFISTENLSESDISALTDKQYVFIFKESAYRRAVDKTLPGNPPPKLTYSAITEIKTFRLYFEADGKAYSVGVLSNTDLPDKTPSDPDVPSAPDSPSDDIHLSDIPEWLNNAFAWFRENWYWLVVGFISVVVLVSCVSVIGRSKK